jgi:hypothetical protein
MQREKPSLPAGISGGTAALQGGMAKSQRGSKAQPGGSAVIGGTEPGME